MRHESHFFSTLTATASVKNLCWELLDGGRFAMLNVISKLAQCIIIQLGSPPRQESTSVPPVKRCVGLQKCSVLIASQISLFGYKMF